VRPRLLPPPADERLNLGGGARIAAWIVLLIAVAGALVIANWIDAHGLAPVLVLAPLVFICSNVGGLGLFILLLALADPPPSAGAARKGLAVRMVGVNLGLAAAAVGFTSAWIVDTSKNNDVAGLAALLLLAVAIYLGTKAIRLVRRGWQYEAASASGILATDSRPPILYLRSFQDDGLRAPPTWTRMQKLFSYFSYATVFTVEQEVAAVLSPLGPVIAIGRPRESLPELGAARFYESDDRWQAKVISLMHGAGLVAIRLGETENLRWEIERALEAVPRSRLILFQFGGPSSRLDEFMDKRLGPAIDVSARRRPAWLWFLLSFLIGHGKELGKVYYFGAGGELRVRKMERLLSLKSFFLMAYRPAQSALEKAFGHVLAELKLAPTQRPKRTRRTAFLFAFFLGGMGAQHFYFGRKRRGWISVAFYWTLIPMLWGLVDSLRLLLADEEQFLHQFATPESPAAPATIHTPTLTA
jgi:TM2 domain-containing membrane protein YozV